MKRAYIGLGSNIEDRERYLIEAIHLLDSHPLIHVKNQSHIYETEPYGYKDQGDFLNMVIEIETDMTPHKLLETTQKIEIELGRERIIHWGPRTIDIDILLYENQVINTDDLKIPHPLMKERLFVLKPLSDIYSGTLANEGKPLLKLIQQLEIEDEGVKRWKA